MNKICRINAVLKQVGFGNYTKMTIVAQQSRVYLELENLLQAISVYLDYLYTDGVLSQIPAQEP
jgi:hypothetical protein